MDYWGVNIAYAKAGAIWIAESSGTNGQDKWQTLTRTMHEEGICFSEVSAAEAQMLAGDVIRFNETERLFHEPEVLLFDPLVVRLALYEALECQGVHVLENTEILGSTQAADGAITAFHTAGTDIKCTHAVNATGAWSSGLLANTASAAVPVALQPVFVANWLVTPRHVSEGFPVIADFVNFAYFRRWTDGSLHMHHPRSRGAEPVASAFRRASAGESPDTIREAGNCTALASQVNDFEARVTHRFPALSPVFAGGYNSYFDITPDLKFILGQDTHIPNLYHCLGGGQAFKYAPIFGEIVSDLIVHDQVQDPEIDISTFSITRFAPGAINAAALPESIAYAL